MGTVYEAFQEEPRRAVAIKVMRAEVTSAESLRRFRFEAQLLARLQHPGIAQVYEAGTWTEGTHEIPFIAMEYIVGAKPVTEYVREKHLGLRDRLMIFEQICDAVHHGHQKGIVHRDLKPGNILCDATGRVRVIDFGVARATDSDLAHIAQQTMAGELVGSLPYMSPEQFEADPHNIDTRSDVYSLGVVLYEMLSGRHPHELATSQIHELARRVRETNPRKLGEVDQSLKGEVEAIVHKALDRDRDLRYQSAFGIGEDIRRYLEGEAVAARPQTLRYQFEIFARRNRGLLAASVAMLLVLAGSVIITTTLYLRSQATKERAEQQAARAQAAVEFMENMITSAVPSEYGAEPTVRDLLDQASDTIGETLRDNPEAQIQLRRTLARAYFSLLEVRQSADEVLTAFKLSSSSMGPDHSLSIDIGSEALWMCSAVGMSEDALEIAIQIEASQRNLRGPTDPVTLDARAALAEARESAGQWQEAERELRALTTDLEATLGPAHASSLEIRASLAQLLLKMKRDTESLEIARAAYEDARAALPENDRVLRWAKSVLGAALIVALQFDEAEALYGRQIPAASGFELVIQGDPNIQQDGLQLLVFWETWCPYSQRAVPALEPIFRDYRSSGLEVIGLTRMTRNSTEEKVRAFVAENEISFAVAKDDGRAWNWFEAQGTPWMAIVRNGRVVWEYSVSSPEEIPSRMIAALVRSG
ncbi:hypothetical protein DRQ53_05675 [bacterium]|nr:MAG: hypothetical protein DRQ53_05675 [bacterium]